MEVLMIPLIYPVVMMFIIFWTMSYFLEAFEVAIDLIWTIFDD